LIEEENVMRRLLEWIEWVVYERELGVAAEVRVKD
jgi:hypothetical protein